MQATRSDGGAGAEGKASCEPRTGRVYLSPGVEIETDDGEPPALTPGPERWAEALQVIAEMGERAEAFVAERIRALEGDPFGRARWRVVLKRIALVREASDRDAAAGGQ